MGKGGGIALLLVAVAALSWWLQRSPGPELQQQASDQTQREPDYYMERFELTSLNQDGKPAYKLYADNMLHYSIDDSATLEKPHLVLFRNDEEFWDIRAESGLVSNGGESVLLEGEVIILRVNPTHAQALQVMTSDLTVRPRDKSAETSAKVTIKDDRGVTTAIGMRADLNQRRVMLLSNVRGTYVPQSR